MAESMRGGTIPNPPFRARCCLRNLAPWRALGISLRTLRCFHPWSDLLQQRQPQPLTPWHKHGFVRPCRPSLFLLQQGGP